MRLELTRRGDYAVRAMLLRAEGDWKTAAMVRALKVMSANLDGGGVSFMEDYTYHLPSDGRNLSLGAHMLEVCPSIAAGRPRVEVHPLSIGAKDDPVRLVFDARPGAAVLAAVIYYHLARGL